MTADLQETSTDFSVLIDRVINDEQNDNLAAFLDDFQVIEHERRRSPSGEERELIRAATLAFLQDRRFGSLGMAEFHDLDERLARHAAQEELFATEEGIKIRNACFDAMVCIKALRARLQQQLNANAILRARTTSQLSQE